MISPENGAEGHTAAGTEEGTTEPKRLQLASGAGLAGGLIVLFLLLRIMAIAHWDWYIAAEIADSMNFGDSLLVVLGTLFAQPNLMAIIVIVLFPLSAVDLFWRTREKRGGLLGLLLLVSFLIIAAAALTTTLGMWWVPAASAVITAVLAAMRYRWRTGRRRAFITTVLRATGVLSVACALVLSIVVDTPWMLREQITTTDKTIDGYVLETPSGFLKVLNEEPRQVEIILSDEVTSRTIIE